MNIKVLALAEKALSVSPRVMEAARRRAELIYQQLVMTHGTDEAEKIALVALESFDPMPEEPPANYAPIIAAAEMFAKEY